MNINLKLGDCLQVLKDLPDNSVDSIITDPPYGISFMSKKWDYDVPSVEVWTECLRVLKPGGHLLSFSGSRTYHRMAVRIEDAGFEISDQIMWVYGSGFPKSHNIGKAVDKLFGNEREVVGTKRSGIAEGPFGSPDESKKHIEETKGTSEWEGWGTALKPSHEPIVLARKPLTEKSVAENVLRWGTGGINIDECRIGYNDLSDRESVDRSDRKGKMGWRKDGYVNGEGEHTLLPEDAKGNDIGRWPANIIFDEEAGQILDEQSGISKSGIRKPTGKKSGDYSDRTYGNMGDPDTIRGFNDKGGASRFFYCPKASKKDRDEGMNHFPDYNKYEDTCSDNHSFSHLVKEGKQVLVKNVHPTVKPTDLMLYLIKLVTPKDGIVLDPFMGSGSTGKAAIRGGYNFIGIEKEEEYIKISEARINYENTKRN